MKTALLNTLAWLTGVSKKVLAFILPILAVSTAKALEELLPKALEIVQSLEESDKSGEHKRRDAVDALKAAAWSSGISATSSVLNLAVEMAVAKMKDQS